jgi:hypothetical protein
VTVMNEHVFDDLPRLLSGEAERSVVTTAAAHLRHCDDCRDELISALVAHAALMSAVRFAPDLAVLPTPLAGAPSSVPLSASLPDLSAVFAQVRAESDIEASGAHRRFARGRSLVLASAAVAVLGLAGGAIYVGERGDSSSPNGRSVALAAYGQGNSAASARLIGTDQMVLDASSLPALGAGRYYEVWLTNSARTSMAPVGQLDADGQGDFTVPSAEMASYAAIEVSVQNTDGVGSYSGLSVLRGTYE